MKTLFIILLAPILIHCQAQTEEKFNLGFEKQRNINGLSDDWIKWGFYPLTIDTVAHSGSKAGKITSNDEGEFGSIAYQIPAHYAGKTIVLEGYMKIKNVENGFAGLLLRIDGNGSSLAFDNMQNQKITGTRDWQKYSITLDYPDQAENIYIAGIMVGKGEAWFDDFVLTIDGQNVQTLKESQGTVYKASLDKEFETGSKIDTIMLTNENTNNLVLLGKVWGFLKYYHPEIAKGNYNWDYELFRLLPKYLEAKKESGRDELLSQWITGLGKIEKCKNCDTTTQEAYSKPDLKWITTSGISKSLQDKLQYVYANRNQEKHYYVRMAEGVGNPEFLHEEAYRAMLYPDAGYRLLALFRYWNMIQYFFPNKYLTDKDWNTILPEYLPKFIHAKDELEYELAAIQIIGEVHDTHANLWGGKPKIEELRGKNYAPVHVRFIEDKLVVTDYYNPELKGETGLEIGDIITQIDGKNVKDLVSSLTPYYPASNEAARLRDIATDLLRSQDNEIEIEYLQNGISNTKKIKLYPAKDLKIYHWYKDPGQQCYRLLDNNIGYVTLANIKDEDIPNIKAEFLNTKGIIIDIRNYPSTFVPFALGSFFISSPTPFVKFTCGNVTKPGEFTFTDPLKIENTEQSYKGKLIVIVNELSQSQAEYTAMAFRAGDNTTIIGSTTAGADGNVSTILLPGGLRTMISGIGVYYPDGGQTQRIGIVPDIEVKPTVQGIKEGRDEVLEKAIELISSQ